MSNEDRVRRAQLARTEARETIAEQTAKLSDINEKAVQIFRLNIVVVGILISGISLSIRSEVVTASALSNPFIEFGVGLLFSSIVFASVTYTSTRGEIGVNPDDVTDRILEDRFDYDLVEEGLAEAYATWIQENYRANTKNALLFTLTLLTTVTGICYLLLGAVEVYTAPLPWHTNLWGLTLFVLLGKLSGLPGQLRRWRKMANPENSIRSWSKRIFDGIDRSES
ncbi:hypothetical protein [Halorussus lipolyticus]|uniref:hypothetical protein n=1 Tax=Halorussus lipolyticus TaxID=3034024 RepID=UPI0023E76B63|nr:hypothetical protein [Halorussus sp. DT80]